MATGLGSQLLTDAEVAVAAATAGSAVVRRAYGTWHGSIANSSMGLTTEADLASERAILAVLEHHRPDDARKGEETGRSGDPNAARRWLVDPLCGTVNFVAATPLFAVNVALTDGNTELAAASADPVADEVFWTDGNTAWVRTSVGDAPLTPSAASGLLEVNCDGPPHEPFLGGQLVADRAVRATWAVRVVSTTLAVAWVAAGRRVAYVTDGHFEGNVHFAAGIALCRAAGCVVTDLAGGPLHTGRGLIAAADVNTHAALVEVIGPHLQAVQGA